MTIAPEAIGLIREFEGLHKRLPNGTVAPYRCPANVPTCGIGTTVWPNGKKVRMDDLPITPKYAEECLMYDLTRKYAPGVHATVKIPMHSLMWGSCYSLAYNIGTGAFKRSTVARMINQQRWNEVPRAFAMWRMGGGRVLSGLERRRQAEIALFAIGLKQMQTGRSAPPVPVRRPSSEPSIWQRILEWMFGRPAAA